MRDISPPYSLGCVRRACVITRCQTTTEIHQAVTISLAPTATNRRQVAASATASTSRRSRAAAAGTDEDCSFLALRRPLGALALPHLMTSTRARCSSTSLRSLQVRAAPALQLMCRRTQEHEPRLVGRAGRAHVVYNGSVERAEQARIDFRTRITRLIVPSAKHSRPSPTLPTAARRPSQPVPTLAGALRSPPRPDLAIVPTCATWMAEPALSHGPAVLPRACRVGDRVAGASL